MYSEENDAIIKILQSEARENRETFGGYLINANEGRNGKSCDRTRNGSVGMSEFNNREGMSVYEKINCDKSYIGKKDTSFNKKNYKSVSNIFNHFGS